MQEKKSYHKKTMTLLTIFCVFAIISAMYFGMKKNDSVKVWNQQSVLLSFVDDDATEKLITDYYPILESRDIKGSVAAIMGTQNSRGFATKEQLLELQKQGWDILNHSCDVSSLAVKDAEEKLKFAKKIAVDSDFEAAKNILVYPNGYTNKEIQTIVAHYFDYALGVEPFSNTLPLDRLEIDRFFVGSNEKDNLEQINAMMEHPCWIIVSTHSANFDPPGFERLVDSILEKDCQIVTVTEAIEMIEASEP